MSVDMHFPSNFKGDLITASDSGYGEAIARWAINAQRKAKVVAFVKDANDVSLAIEYAKSNGLQIAIRGGGHNPAGASSSEGGLVIDLSRYLNQVKVDAEKKLAYVSGGALWSAVDKAAMEHSLATVGGTVNHTGVGGLTLGGGYGFLSPRHGLAIDNLVQATIVLADGTIKTVSSNSEDSDLFWAIRGGGSNFGVCTEFVFKLHPQRRTVFAGIVIIPGNKLDQILTVTGDWWAKGPSDKEGMVQFLTVGPDGNPCMALLLFYNGSEAEGRANYKAFFDIGPVVDMAREIPYEEVNSVQNEMAAHGSCAYMKGLSHKAPDHVSISKAFEIIVQLAKVEGFRPTLAFEYFPLGKILSVPRAATAFRRDVTPAVLVLMIWKDDLPENTERARSAAHEIRDIIASHQPALTKEELQGYANYDPDSEGVPGNRVQLVFGENYPRLQQIKQRYDPGQVFSKWFPIVPLAPTV